jgi:hypothetical protein
MNHYEVCGVCHNPICTCVKEPPTLCPLCGKIKGTCDAYFYFRPDNMKRCEDYPDGCIRHLGERLADVEKRLEDHRL